MLIKDPGQRPSIEKLITVPIIRKAIISLVIESESELFFELRNILIEKDSTLELEIPIPIDEIRVSYSLSHIKELPTTISQIDLPLSYQAVAFVYLSGDRLYTAADETLYVYSMSDHTSPIATYQLGGELCDSGIITDNHLYLSDGRNKLRVFIVTTSLSQPLVPV